MDHTEKTYDVYWERAGTLGAVVNTHPQHVLYQLTGQHPVYGSQVLIYIGRTEQADVSSRLGDHQRDWGQLEADSIVVRVASIGEFDDWEGWRSDTRKRHERLEPKEVKAVEELLIYAHQPGYNSRSIKTAPTGLGGSHLRLFNTGASGQLLLEVSTRRYCDLRRPMEVDDSKRV